MRIDHDGLHVDGATEAVLLFSAASSFNGYDRCPATEGKDPGRIAAEILAVAGSKNYEQLVQAHKEDYSALFGRVELRLGESPVAADVPTDKRIVEYGADDPRLVEQLFQYGRYLMIAGSRQGTQPTNLQGIWSHEVRPVWSCNYTLNINEQMNYWPAETCNLSECHEPLLRFIGELAENGKKTAEINYGCKGWTAHHNSDIWRQSAPPGDYGHGNPLWANWPMGGVWLCQHLWEHYAFTGDTDYLREKAYPVMKEAALFCLDWLIDDGQGRLITSPSTSPEHRFVTEDGGKRALSQAAAMDLSLIRELFGHCIEASRLFGIDQALCKQMEEALGKLPPLQIGKYGQLQEWLVDFEDEDVHHRHVSHLYGVFPGAELTEESSPELFEAAKVSLERRGDEGTGWSLAWKVALWARFRDGDQALRLIANLLRPAEDNGIDFVGAASILIFSMPILRSKSTAITV
jgi:alpha-L-fucosidase 2